MADLPQLLARPRPPAEILTIEALAAADRFVPAPDLHDWIRAAYFSEEGDLFTEEHGHLEEANIGCLWTTAENSRHGRRIVGQAEIPMNSYARLGKWQRGRGVQQLEKWFACVPDFLITLDAIYADEVDDATFCALVDHELFHCAQAEDEFGQRRFSKTTGLPVWCIKGHDVEEFTAVVRRFGIEAAGEKATDFVIAAARRPEIGPAKVAGACGTCALRKVA